MQMQARFIIGQYLPGESLLHRSHPVHKILLLVVYCFLIFQLKKSTQLIAVLPLFMATFWFCKIPFTMVFHGLKPLGILMLITFAIHGFTDTNTDQILFEIGFLKASTEGFERGFFYCLRLILIVLASSLLTLTTSSVQITYAVDKLLRPLKIFHFPVAEFSLMLSVSLRFIPVLMEELCKLIMAQKARGASFRHGNLKRRLHCLTSLLIPLFNSALDRADQLAVAMEVRGFDPDTPRTSVNKYAFGIADITLTTIVILWITSIPFLLNH